VAEKLAIKITALTWSCIGWKRAFLIKEIPMFASRLVLKAIVLSVLAASIILIVFTLPSSEPPERAFYYWKTHWVASPEVLSHLKENGIRKLYMRFFDVGWNDVGKSAYPISALEFESRVPDGIEIVPVVYLTNNVFLNIPYADVEQLAENMWTKVRKMSSDERLSLRQVQIDCDWSDDSRRSYFHFADILSRRLKPDGITVSSTIRLHQIKYSGRTGIPPVSRGMLMFYNFGRIEAESERSSIFNADDASRYTSFIERYPLPLDVVLPLFSWSIHSREGEVLGVFEKLTAADLDSFEGFRKLSANKYTSTRAFFFRGRYFMAADLVVIEETTPADTLVAARLAKRGAGGKKYSTVALFDLDETYLKKFGSSSIGGVLASF
jgi:hypothetical protein